jgi:uncharacterized membrane protein YtjA (UPF0391 family)
MQRTACKFLHFRRDCLEMGRILAAHTYLYIYDYIYSHHKALKSWYVFCSSAYVSRLNNEGSLCMLHYALVFLVLALVAAFFGFGGVAGTAASIAQVLFFVFLVLLLFSVLSNLFRGRSNLP